MTKAELPESMVEHSGVTNTDVQRVRINFPTEASGYVSTDMTFTARFVFKADTQTPRGT
jgi:hypothetical protein